MDIPSIYMPDPPVLNSYNAIARISIAPFLFSVSGADGAVTWSNFGANVALYVPFYLTAPQRVTKMFIYNGGGTAGNLDLGIYDLNGTRLVSSGSTAQSGTNVYQTVDVTDTDLGRGFFFMALAMSSGSAQVLIYGLDSKALSTAGGYMQASAFALPATATFAQWTVSQIPNFGVIFNPRTLAL